MVGEQIADKIESYSFRAGTQLTKAALLAAFHAIRKHHRTAPGKESMKNLTANASKESSAVQCLEVSKIEMHGFEKYAKRYGVRFSLVRMKNDPTNYILSFPQKDLSKFNSAINDFMKDGKYHGNLEQKVEQARQEAFTVNQAKQKEKEKGPRTKAKTPKPGKGAPSL